MGEGRKPGEEIGGGNLHHTERTLVTRGQRRSIGVGIMGRQPTFVGRNRRGSERTIVGEEKEAGCVRSSFEEGWGREDGNVNEAGAKRSQLTMGQFLRGKGYAERGEVHTLPIRGKKKHWGGKKERRGAGKKGEGEEREGKGVCNRTKNLRRRVD